MARVSVNFSDPVYESLQKLAKDKGISVTALIRNSIALGKWFEETRRDGAKILVEREGEVREVLPI